MKKLILLCLSAVILFGSEYRYRKYEHVKTFNEALAQKTVELGLKYDVPPAAVLAIASVESGYGRGYIAKISGNILSLGANKGEKQLPPLYLPHKKEPFEILYNPKEIAKYKKNQLIYKKRAKSFKKDYRPLPYAGTHTKLEYFDENPKKRIEANLNCIEDFCRIWINRNYRYKPFKQARVDLEKRVQKYGKDALFMEEVVKEFVHNIGGKPNSFNYRKSWPKKVISVMKHSGLVSLTNDIKSGKSFEEAWYKN